MIALVVAAVASAAVWLLAAAGLYLARRPAEPPVGERTLELGPEPPAVANFVVNDFRVTEDAVPATLVDLAARNVVEVEWRGPEVFYIRLLPATDQQLTAYELRVVEHLRRIATDGVVPADALTTGPSEQSKKWWQRFEGEVVADAQRRGLSRDALNSGVFTVLTAAAIVPSLLAWAAWEFEAGLGAFFGAVALLGWIRSRHPQRETAEGLAAASRWLGVRAELAKNEEFTRHSPLTVELWDRLLAYGAALGVASGASRPLPMGVESDTNAWSGYGGRWRSVRISYPRLWPPGWGAEPLAALAVGLLVVVAAATILYLSGLSQLDAGVFAIVPLAIVGIPVVLGVAVVIMAASDWRTAVEVTGPILRLRSFGDDKKRRYYVAVDDGSSREIRAFRVKPRLYEGLEQGEVVTVQATANLGCVRWIIPGPDSAAAAGSID
jgi:hypothetical protein